MTPVKNDVLSLSSLELANVSDLYRYFHFPSPLHDNFDIRELDHGPSDIGGEDFATAEKNTNVEILCNSFRSVIAELHLGKPNRAELIHAHIRLLLLYLQRIGSITPQRPIPSMMATTSQSLALRFHQSVQRHISTAEISDEVKTVDFYARQLLVHPNHLSAVIKKCTGQSPSHFIHQQLLDKAKTLLTQTAYSAKEIAYRLAFKDPAHFNTFFRKHTNQTPINFREHHVK
jgi:AraC-like DNA-binding protein